MCHRTLNTIFYVIHLFYALVHFIYQPMHLCYVVKQCLFSKRQTNMKMCLWKHCSLKTKISISKTAFWNQMTKWPSSERAVFAYWTWKPPVRTLSARSSVPNWRTAGGSTTRCAPTCGSIVWTVCSRHLGYRNCYEVWKKRISMKYTVCFYCGCCQQIWFFFLKSANR